MDQLLGEFERVRRYRLKPDGTINSEPYAEEVEWLQLMWGSDTLEIETRRDEGVFKLAFNGRALGQIIVGPERAATNPDIIALLAEHADMVDIASAVGQDLDRVPLKIPNP